MGGSRTSDFLLDHFDSDRRRNTLGHGLRMGGRSRWRRAGAGHVVHDDGCLEHGGCIALPRPVGVSLGVKLGGRSWAGSPRGSTSQVT